MKLLYFILIIFLNLNSLFGQQKIKVKTETIKTASGGMGQRLYYYDETGFLVKETWATGYTLYVKDENGKIASQASYNKKNIQEDTIYYKYDDKGNLIRQTRFYPQRGDTYVEQFVLEYDAKGNVVKETQLDKDSVLEWEYIYTYNDNNEQLTCQTIFQGELRDDYEYEYKNGKMVKKTLFDRNSDDKSRKANTIDEFFYDKNGNLTKKKVQSFDYGKNRMAHFLYTYKYDKNNNLISLTREEEGKLDEVKSYSYEYY